MRHRPTHMTLTVLRLLFKDARSWWYHRKLRQQGRVAEARRRERKCVQKHALDLDRATVLHIGRGGWTLYRNKGRLKGCGDVEDAFVQAAIRAGVPVFDTTTVPMGRLGSLLRGPLPAEEPLVALEHARSLGARTYNAPARCESQRQRVDLSADPRT